MSPSKPTPSTPTNWQSNLTARLRIMTRHPHSDEHTITGSPPTNSLPQEILDQIVVYALQPPTVSEQLYSLETREMPYVPGLMLINKASLSTVRRELRAHLLAHHAPIFTTASTGATTPQHIYTGPWQERQLVREMAEYHERCLRLAEKGVGGRLGEQERICPCEVVSVGGNTGEVFRYLDRGACERSRVRPSRNMRPCELVG